MRCHGSWHEALVAGGTLRLSAHTPEELRREEILHRFGAPLEGCAAVRVAWLSGRQVPRGLREQRQHLFDLAFHGDAEGVRSRLDAGFDPYARIEGGSTLLHYLAYLDHRDLLPYLLAAGLDIGAVDLHGRTPLRVALDHGADALAADLRRAGA